MNRADKIAKVRALYERAGTPGEKAAAKAALERLGVPVDGKPKVTMKTELEGADELMAHLHDLQKAVYDAGVSMSDFYETFSKVWNWKHM